MAFIVGDEYQRSTKTEITLRVGIATTSPMRAEIEAECIGVLYQSQMLKKRGKQSKELTIVEDLPENTNAI
jgi:hypothetical protein